MEEESKGIKFIRSKTEELSVKSKSLSTILSYTAFDIIRLREMKLSQVSSREKLSRIIVFSAARDTLLKSSVNQRAVPQLKYIQLRV